MTAANDYPGRVEWLLLNRGDVELDLTARDALDQLRTAVKAYRRASE
jgi:hypothetical protein